VAEGLRRLLAIASLALAACSGETPVNMKDPGSVTRKFVEAYNARDLARMLPLVDQVNIDAVKNALADGVNSEAYQSIFMPEMVELLAKDGGKVTGPRYDRHGAVFQVGETVSGDVYAIELSRREADGVWLIDEFSMMSEREFLELPEQPQER
jgi:hypothetical protein